MKSEGGELSDGRSETSACFARVVYIRATALASAGHLQHQLQPFTHISFVHRHNPPFLFCKSPPTYASPSFTRRFYASFSVFLPLSVRSSCNLRVPFSGSVFKWVVKGEGRGICDVTEFTERLDDMAWVSFSELGVGYCCAMVHVRRISRGFVGFSVKARYSKASCNGKPSLTQ